MKREQAKTPDWIKEKYPPFVVKKMLEMDENPEINDQIPTRITDFLRLYLEIWVISNKPYQEESWGKRGQWGDNYMETMETFLGDGRAVLDTSDYAVEMTPKQREMLTKLYDMIDCFTEDPEAPDSEYGENDEAIVNDPKWQNIGEYAKLTYEELSGDDLDAWEQQKN